MRAVGFETLSLQGHPTRLALDSDDVLAAIADNIAALDIPAIHAEEARRQLEHQWQGTIKRMQCDKGRPGQVAPEDVPRALSRRGDPEDIDVKYLDDYIEDRLKYKAHLGMMVFKFWNGDDPVYAATVIDFIHRDGEVWDWHVELYQTRKDANLQVRIRKALIREKILPAANDNVRAIWEDAA